MQDLSRSDYVALQRRIPKALIVVSLLVIVIVCVMVVMILIVVACLIW